MPPLRCSNDTAVFRGQRLYSFQRPLEADTPQTLNTHTLAAGLRRCGVFRAQWAVVGACKTYTCSRRFAGLAIWISGFSLALRPQTHNTHICPRRRSEGRWFEGRPQAGRGLQSCWLPPARRRTPRPTQRTRPKAMPHACRAGSRAVGAALNTGHLRV